LENYNHVLIGWNRQKYLILICEGSPNKTRTFVVVKLSGLPSPNVEHSLCC